MKGRNHLVVPIVVCVATFASLYLVDSSGLIYTGGLRDRINDRINRDKPEAEGATPEPRRWIFNPDRKKLIDGSRLTNMGTGLLWVAGGAVAVSGGIVALALSISFAIGRIKHVLET